MPRTAIPSRACLACRARHLKCSEERPVCRACARADLTCAYKTESEIVFRNQTHDLAGRYPQQGVHSRDLRKAITTSRHQPKLVQLSLPQDKESVALSVYFTRYCSPVRDVNGDPGMNNILPHLHSKSSPDSALNLAISAYALAIVGRWPERVDFKRLSAQRYFESIEILNRALTSNDELMKDEILAAVMQIQAYERLNSPHVPGVALCHTKGILSLIEARGMGTFGTQTSIQLLSVARDRALMSYLSPIDDLEDDECIWTKAPGDEASNVSVKLVKTAAEVRLLRRMVKRNSSQIANQEAIGEVIAAALILDDTLLSWPSTLPTAWTPMAADWIPFSVLSAGVFQDMCIVYCNIWAANSWIKYHLIRVTIHAIILDQISRLPATQQHQELAHKSLHIIQLAINAVCSSVPFYLGSRDTSRTTDQPIIEFPSESSMPLTEEVRESLIIFGEWFLFWPLSRILQNIEFITLLYPSCIGDRQIAWIREQVVRNGQRAATRSSL